MFQLIIKVMSRKPNLSKLAGQSASTVMQLTDESPATSKSKPSQRKTRKAIKIEYETDNPSIKLEESVKQIKSEMGQNIPSKKLKKSSDDMDSKPIKLETWEPKHWLQVLDNLRQMRSEQSAPVDTMGCHMCSDETADEKTRRYHILVSLMLSSQTKDQVTYQAMARLRNFGLTPDNIVKANPTELEKLIHPVSFYKNKTKYIQKASQILLDQYESDIPETVDGLMKLPGVGPKMAHICMDSGWGIVSGIGVDTHVHRITNRLKWLPKATKEPEQTRIALQSWLPKEHWTEVNKLLVGFGQTICTPVNPKCKDCLNNNICPSSDVKKNKKDK